jgi:asparagine synthase (glutamine-hydrolysing)
MEGSSSAGRDACAIVATCGDGTVHQEAVAALGGAPRLLTDARSPVQIAASGGGPALGTFVDRSVALAAFGSGLVRAAETPDRAAAELAGRWFRHGTGFLDGFGDDFVVVLADLESGRLVAGTTSGPYRLFRRGDARRVIVSTSCAAVARSSPSPTVDRSYEDFFLAYGFHPDGRSPFAGVRSLPAGSVAVWPGSERHPVPAPRAVADRPDESVARGGSESIDRLLGLLLEAVDAQAGASSQQAVLLGGFDSALVAALLTRTGRRVHTFTFGFCDPTYEQRNVDVVGEFLGCEHTWVPITPDVIGEGLREFAHLYNQPVTQPHYLLHTLEASRTIRRFGFDRVFSGDGCDAAFFGYPTVNRRARGVALGARVPTPVVRGALAATDQRVLERRLGHVWRMGRGMLEDLVADPSVRGHLPFAIFGESSRRRLRRGPPPPQAETIAQIRRRLSAGLDPTDPARLALHGNGLPGQSTTKVEGAVAATGVVQASPFLDGRVRAFAQSFPTEAFRSERAPAGALGKELLVTMALEHELLPRGVVLQPKQSPVTSPVDAWYAGPLRGTVFHLLDGLPFDWDRAYVEDLLRPKLAERLYRRRVDAHALRALGLLLAYAAFTGTAARSCPR